MANDMIELLRRPYGNLTFGEREQVASTIEALQAENAALNRIALFLWNRLDEIDTMDDIAKGDDKLYRSGVRREHHRRFEVGDTDGYNVSFNLAALQQDNLEPPEA